MKIKEIHVKNFRSILDATLTFDDLTILVGRNGSGKSTFLTALKFFYDLTYIFTDADYYDEDTSNDIEIAVTYTALNEIEKREFKDYLNNYELIVVKKVSYNADRKGSYHAKSWQYPKFSEIRKISGKREATSQFNKLIEEDKEKDKNSQHFASLQQVSNHDDLMKEMTKWEQQPKNKNLCELTLDDGSFFGYKGVGQGKIRNFTKFIFVPAVKDAQEDAVEGKKSSAIKELMDLTVRNVLRQNKAIAEFQSQVQDQYRDIYDENKLNELKDLSSNLSKTLQYYVEDAEINLQWQDLSDVQLPEPSAQVKLVEDEYPSTVQRVGHGLQRALIFTLLQHLATTEKSEASAEVGKEAFQNSNESPTLILAIEEPELYQHPSRQRHFATVLRKLTGTENQSNTNMQILFTTHSPLLTGIDNFDSIRVVRKFDNENNSEEKKYPKIAKLLKAEMSEIAEKLWKISEEKGPEFTSETLRPRLRSIMTPWMNEGFFADVVVLVEGVSDRAAILGAAATMERNLDSLGITVIPCSGKNNIDRPYLIFTALSIPTYIIWDGDFEAKNSKPDINRYLLRLLNKAEEDWPDFIDDRATCLKKNLENKLEEEIDKGKIGQFTTILNEVQEEVEIPKKEHAIKNPEVIKRVIEKVHDSGIKNLFLEDILKKIVNLQNK